MRISGAKINKKTPNTNDPPLLRLLCGNILDIIIPAQLLFRLEVWLKEELQEALNMYEGHVMCPRYPGHVMCPRYPVFNSGQINIILVRTNHHWQFSKHF